MNMINDGGPAFPVWELNGKGQPEMTGFGMSLRDHFAAMAMAAFIAEPVSEGGSSTVGHWATQLQRHTQMSGPDIVAHVAYMMADAMLCAREIVNADPLKASKEAESALRNKDANMNEQIAAAIARAIGQEG